jgi:hypothetical protein
MDRFDKFTDRARKVLTLAQDEAQRFNHTYIGTEHLLLGLVREGEGVAARVLENMNVELAKVRTAVEFIIVRADRPAGGEVGLTGQAKRVIELAIDEARRLGHHYIGTEHLLLGFMRLGGGIAYEVLSSLGATPDRTRHEVIRVLSAGFSEESSGSSIAPMMLSPEPVPPEEAERFRQMARSFVEIETSPLRRVIGVGLESTASGISVELIALEIRERGAVLYWKAHRRGAGMIGGPDITLTDELGTTYRFLPAGWSSSDGESKGETRIAPAPPPDARSLRVVVERFGEGRWAPGPGPFGHEPPAVVTGPWRFEIELG